MASFYGEITSVKDVSARLEVEFENESSSGFTGRRYVRLTVEDESGELIYDERQYRGTNRSDGTITTWNITISGLSPDTTYYWDIYLGYQGTGDESITWLTGTDDSGSFTTTWPLPICDLYVVTHNSVEFYIEGVEDAYDYWHYYGAFVYDKSGNQVIGPEWTEYDENFFIELTGLMPNTAYTAAIWVSEREDGEAPNARVILLEFTTDPPYQVESSYDSIILTLQGGEEISQDYPYFSAVIYDASGDEINNTGWHGFNNDITITFSDLEPDTEYIVEVLVAQSSSGANSRSLGEAEVSTLKIPMPSFTISATTEKSVTVHVTGVADAFDYWHYYRAAVVDADDNVVAETAWKSYSANFYLTLPGLTANTRYWVTVWVSASSSGSDPCEEINTKRFDTPALGQWSWEVSNGSATDTQTQIAYSILIGESPVNAGFSHLVWNDFVDKIKEMRKHFGDGTWDRDGGNYLSYDDCHVSRGDTLSASLYNSAKHQISSIKSTDIADVYRNDDKLTGYHIVHLTDVLNAIIKEL